VWNIVRWPGAFLAATLAFSYVYYVTPDVEHRAFHWITPGAVVGVLTWLLVSFGLSTYLSSIGDVGALYGTFAAAIVLVGWLWLTNVALLFGAELNAEIEREKQISEGVSPAQTLDLPDLGAR
jgi:membrane protein